MTGSLAGNIATLIRRFVKASVTLRLVTTLRPKAATLLWPKQNRAGRTIIGGWSVTRWWPITGAENDHFGCTELFGTASATSLQPKWSLGSCWLVVDWLLTGCWPVVDRLLTSCWLVADWLLTGCWLVVDQLLTSCWSTVDQLLTGCWLVVDLLTGCWLVADWLLTSCWPVADQLLTSYWPVADWSLTEHFVISPFWSSQIDRKRSQR